jgi:outer membrane biosynthesis protein TonB
MGTTGMRLMAAVVATSLAVSGLSPLAYAQQQMPPVESTPLEAAEQPMLPSPVPPPADPAMAQAQPPAPGQPAPVLPAPPMQPVPPAPVQAPPPAPAPVVAPPAPVAQSVPPDLFQEALKSEARASGAKQVLYEAGAVVTNVFLIPGRAITCTLGAGLGVVVLALTFGTGYKTAAGAFDEGCGGKWFVTGDDLKPEGGRAFDWER